MLNPNAPCITLMPCIINDVILVWFLLNICLNASRPSVPLSLQAMHICSSAWRTHVALSLQNPNKTFSHSLSPSHAPLFFSTLSPTVVSFSLTVSPSSFFLRHLPHHVSLRRYSLRPHTITPTPLVSLSLYLSLVHPSSYSFITLPERDSPSFFHLLSHRFNRSVLSLHFLLIITMFLCDYD
jgi:hypothetical protein